jgi:hypothetical protein
VKHRATSSGFSRWIFWALWWESHVGLSRFFFLASRDVWSRFCFFGRLEVNYFDILSCASQWIVRYFVGRPTANFLYIIWRVLRSLSLYFVRRLTASILEILSGTSQHEFSRCFLGRRKVNILDNFMSYSRQTLIYAAYLISTWNILDMIFWKDIIG